VLQGDDARHMSRTVPVPVPRSVEKTRVDESVKAIAYKPDEQALTLLFVDEPPFSNAPDVQHGWQRAKIKRQVHQPKSRQRKTIVGALELQSQRVDWKQAPRGHGGT
jgi:hypothetical protein